MKWDIKVYSRRDFAKNVIYGESREKTLAVCISDPWDENLNTAANPLILALHLFFEDSEDEKGISQTDAERIAEFIKEFIKKNSGHYEKIAVHCDAGVSRSAGVAAAIAYYLNGSDSQIFDSPRHVPNMRCYRYVLNALFASEDNIKEAQQDV